MEQLKEALERLDSAIGTLEEGADEATLQHLASQLNAWAEKLESMVVDGTLT